ncbi:transporter substrate-binding domain-containing protein [Paraburkholderia susongensis]|uniref:Amino acid ABC transporter substrate-binding protein, PAAT family n=1 Tax=Paraburkholderia susongensis TaxID=1515439 RepID=A0A1X7J6L9_9BURK|nr:transporter substrate-binding domain-containing protein [Paraburkholderia susongensis]SMG23142.1 amino acid ABC transporter substrate-binding protein, PAAT family [Paraburkholderia susongensis]
MKSKRKGVATWLIGVVLGSAMAAGSVQAKEWKSVTIALDGSYAPWNLTLPGGKLSGFEPELVENLCARAQIKCNLVTQDWDGMIPGLQAGKFDVLMDAISITPDREKILALSKPYAATPATFSVADTKILPKASGNDTVKLDNDARSNQPAIEALRKALKGKTIGLQSGTIYTAFVNNNFKDVASIRVYKSAPERDLDLTNGRIDASFDDITYFTANASKSPVIIAGPTIAGPIWGPGEGLAFRKTDTDLKAKFDAAIVAAQADGTIKKLALKWFKTDVMP